MNFNWIKKIRISKIIGWTFLAAGILNFVSLIPDHIIWKLKEDNYNKQYVYSSGGDLYYEVNNKKIYIEKIYDTSNEIIELEVPDKNTVLMYCFKNNIKECVYIDMNNSLDDALIHPLFYIWMCLVLIWLGLLYVNEIEIKRPNKKKVGLFFPSVYVFCLCLFLAGVGLFMCQISNAVDYFSLKNDNYVTTATIYSKIYNISGTKYVYKPVSYYYVDNKKYIYINDSYLDGELENDYGKTFDLYYNKDNPSKVSKKEKPVNFFVMIIGIGLIIFSYRIVFHPFVSQERLVSAYEKPRKKEWKI